MIGVLSDACSTFGALPFFLLLTLHPPQPTLFPYTTLFRSRAPARSAKATRPSKSLFQVLRAIIAPVAGSMIARNTRSEEHTSELQSLTNLVCRLLLEKKNKKKQNNKPKQQDNIKPGAWTLK